MNKCKSQRFRQGKELKQKRFNKLALNGETYIHMMKKLFVKGGLFAFSVKDLFNFYMVQSPETCRNLCTVDCFTILNSASSIF